MTFKRRYIFKCHQRPQIIEENVEPRGQSEILISKRTLLIILTQAIRPDWELNQGHLGYHFQVARTVMLPLAPPGQTGNIVRPAKIL